MNDLVSFLVLVRSGNHTDPVFVKASDANDARTKVMAKRDYLKHTFTVTFEMLVIDETSLEDVLPDLKNLAWQYYRKGSNAKTTHVFDGVWDAHGLDLSDDLEGE